MKKSFLFNFSLLHFFEFSKMICIFAIRQQITIFNHFQLSAYEYWNRENEYIKNSGIYTDEEVQQILANHEEIRRDKKEEAREWYEFEQNPPLCHFATLPH